MTPEAAKGLADAGPWAVVILIGALLAIGLARAIVVLWGEHLKADAEDNLAPLPVSGPGSLTLDGMTPADALAVIAPGSTFRIETVRRVRMIPRRGSGWSLVDRRERLREPVRTVLVLVFTPPDADSGAVQSDNPRTG